MSTNANIIGYLQKKNFFTVRPSVSPTSRFTYVSNHTPQKSRPKELPSSAKSQANFPSTVSKNNKNPSNFEQLKYSTVCKNEIKTKEKQNKQENKEQTNRLFDSSRVQIKMCLQELSRKVSTEIRMLQGALAKFTAHIENMFQKRIGSLRQQLLDSVEAILAQTKETFKKGISQEQFIRQTQIKGQLKQLDFRLKKLKGQMDGNWKKVAGQVLGQALDQKVQKLLSESQSLRKGIEGKDKEKQEDSGQQGWNLMKQGIDLLVKNKFDSRPHQTKL